MIMSVPASPLLRRSVAIYAVLLGAGCDTPRSAEVLPSTSVNTPISTSSPSVSNSTRDSAYESLSGFLRAVNNVTARPYVVPSSTIGEYLNESNSFVAVLQWGREGQTGIFPTWPKPLQRKWKRSWITEENGRLIGRFVAFDGLQPSNRRYRMVWFTEVDGKMLIDKVDTDPSPLEDEKATN